jgi:hypothetical protein
MKPTTDAELTIPPSLVAEIQATADVEHRPAAEVLRDALERYLADARKARAGAAPGHRSRAAAAARMREMRKGNVLPEGMTIRDLMTYGRA